MPPSPSWDWKYTLAGIRCVDDSFWVGGILFSFPVMGAVEVDAEGISSNFGTLSPNFPESDVVRVTGFESVFETVSADNFEPVDPKVWDVVTKGFEASGKTMAPDGLTDGVVFPILVESSRWVRLGAEACC